MQRLVMLAAVLIGVTLGYVDSRPTWDDTGVMAAALFTSSLVLGALAPQKPWAIALAVGLWIPLAAIMTHANFASLLALGFAIAGAYAGAWLCRTIVTA